MGDQSSLPRCSLFGLPFLRSIVASLMMQRTDAFSVHSWTPSECVFVDKATISVFLQALQAFGSP